MKDANDHRTVDGFADLLQGLDDQPPTEVPPVRPGVALGDLAELIGGAAEPAPGAARKPKGKPGPKPRNGQTMSGADRARAFRERKRAEREADRERLAADKPTSKVIDLCTDLRGALIEREGR